MDQYSYFKKLEERDAVTPPSPVKVEQVRKYSTTSIKKLEIPLLNNEIDGNSPNETEEDPGFRLVSLSSITEPTTESENCQKIPGLGDIVQPTPKPRLLYDNERYWPFATNVRNKLKFVYENSDTYKDVTFIIGRHPKREKIQAHKLILRLGSPVLERKLQFVDDKDTEVIVYEDVEPYAFKSLLKFFYTDEFDGSQLAYAQLMVVLDTATKFAVTPLATRCAEVLPKYLSNETAVTLYERGKSTSQVLVDAAFAYMNRHAKEIFESDSLYNITYDCMWRLAKSDCLILDEFVLFKALMRWARYLCRKGGADPSGANIRNILDKILYEVRFPIMEPSVFAKKVVPTAVLLQNEEREILRYFCDSEIPKLDKFKYHQRAFRRNPGEIRQRRSTTETNSSTKSVGHDNTSTLSTSIGTVGPDNSSILSTSIGSADGTNDAASHTSCASLPSTHISPKKETPEIKYTPKKHKLELLEVFGEEVEKKEKRFKCSIKTPTPATATMPNVIHKENEEIDYCKLIEDCKLAENRKEIESIKLINVRVDFSKNKTSRVRLPSLKNVYLKIKMDVEKNENDDWLSMVDLSRLLFFYLRPDRSKFSLSELWSLNVNITLIINNKTLLKIDHMSQSLLINNLNDGKLILNATKKSELKSLVLSTDSLSSCVNEVASCTNLNSLSLLNVEFPYDMTKILKSFENLTELSMFGSTIRDVDISAFPSSVKLTLQKLSIGLTQIKTTCKLPFSKLDEILLFRCDWDDCFENSFCTIFPNVKSVLIHAAAHDVKPSFIKQLLNMKSIREICCGPIDWRRMPKHLKSQLISFGVKEGPTCFGLEKVTTASEAPKWTLHQHIDILLKIQQSLIVFFENSDIFGV